MTTRELSRLPAAKPRFIEPMYARLVNKLPEGEDWLYEVKFDGYRCLAARDARKATLWSRRGNLFTEQFPSVTRACQRLPKDTLVDGEIVAVDKRMGESLSTFSNTTVPEHRRCSFTYSMY